MEYGWDGGFLSSGKYIKRKASYGGPNQSVRLSWDAMDSQQ